MIRSLTGLQSTGSPHLGNLFNSILPAIKLSKNLKYQSFLFIADLHTLTQIKNSKILRDNTLITASVCLSFDLDFEKIFFYRQSDVSEVTELMWILLCYFPYYRLKIAHAFKDKSNYIYDINSGLFVYPILMAADILLYDANIIPVGKDQIQHIEFARKIAKKINKEHGDIFVLPEPFIKKNTELILGVDGFKMSKSRNNLIDIFLPEKELKKQIFSIKTDSKLLEQPKNPDTDNIFNLFKIIEEPYRVEELKKKYLSGNFGYLDAKKELFNSILEKFKVQRKKFNYYKNHYDKVEKILKFGAEKTKKIAQEKLKKVRSILGYKNNF